MEEIKLVFLVEFEFDHRFESFSFHGPEISNHQVFRAMFCEKSIKED